MMMRTSEEKGGEVMVMTTALCRDCGRDYYFYFMPCCPGCGSEDYETIKTEEIKLNEERECLNEKTACSECSVGQVMCGLRETVKKTPG